MCGPVIVKLVNNNLHQAGQFSLQGHVAYINTAVHRCVCACVHLCDVFHFLGTFTKLQKVTFSFVISVYPLSVCLSVCME